METDPSNWYSCPVVTFLGLALADDVYEGLSDLINCMHLAPSANSFQMPRKPNKGDLPVCCSFDERNRKFSPHKIMTGAKFWEYITEIGYRLGYKDKLSGHAFRRGCGNSLEGTAALNLFYCC
jgi:hypothetical protein